MAKLQSQNSNVMVRNAETGEFVSVRGAGALKGHLKLKKSVDLTKPIASQAIKNSTGPGAVGPKKH